MFKARHLFTTLAGVLGLTALAPEASARRYTQCDSSDGATSQTCQFDNAFRARIVRSSNAAATAHAITISVERAASNFSATAVALDQNGRLISGSSVTTTGSTQTRAFSTAAGIRVRMLQTTIDNPNLIVPIAFGTAVTTETWPSNLNTRIFKHDGTLTGHCRASGRSDAALTSHTISANFIKGGGCVGQVIDANGGIPISFHDFTTGGSPDQQTFTTTVANRPRRVGAAVAELP